jgi:hypothetical protein
MKRVLAVIGLQEKKLLLKANKELNNDYCQLSVIENFLHRRSIV